ncbi:MAG: BON domain-containing protein, partial [Planctomycetota bacterium]
MRLGPKFLTLLSLILAGAGAYLSAMAAAGMVERVSERAVKTELQVDGYDWVSVETDGLQVILTGTAPTEASRLRAIASAGQVIDATRVRDGMDVLDAAPIAAPRFSVELLRNDSGISLMGLIPASVDRQGLVAELSALARPEPVSDLLSIADYPVPEGWQDALDYAIKALENLPRSKVSIAAGSVQIKAISGSREEKRRLEDDLTRRAPDSVRLALNISAPRPVITPFTLRFASDPEDGIAPRFDACSADTEAARGRILTAARKVGLEGKGDCTLGLGVPTPDWATAAEQAIAAVGELGGGSVTISDVDIALVALPSTPQAQFDRVVGELESNLPEVFSLTPVLPKETGSDNTADGPPEFVATRSPEGQVQIRGRIKDANTRSMIESFARARFGTEAVHTAARTDESLPTDWSVRVLAGLQALALVHNGSLTIQPDF